MALSMLYQTMLWNMTGAEQVWVYGDGEGLVVATSWMRTARRLGLTCGHGDNVRKEIVCGGRGREKEVKGISNKTEATACSLLISIPKRKQPRTEQLRNAILKPAYAHMRVRTIVCYLGKDRSIHYHAACVSYRVRKVKSSPSSYVAGSKRFIGS